MIPRARVVDGRLVDAPFLENPALRRLFSVLDRDGDSARAVGGAVRNALLGAPVHEVDIATTATPDVVMARAAREGLRTIPTGVEHGTVTVLVDGDAFEVTTLREDVETDGRHAKVRFGRDFRSDALRRDFTINALSVEPDGLLHDDVGGLADIAGARVRFIGDARIRIREDYLRILRFFRFHASCGQGAPDAAAFSACIAERGGLSVLSRERVRAELLKLLAARGAADVCTAMEHAGLLALCTGGIAYPARLRACMERQTGDPDVVLRAGALFVAVDEDAERLQERLRLSNGETQRLSRAASALVELHGRDDPLDAGDLRRFLFLHGRRAALDALALAWAETGAAPQAPAWRSADAFLTATPEPTLPFSGVDLLARGIVPGRRMGEILKRLQALWIRAGFPQEPERLARLLDEALADG